LAALLFLVPGSVAAEGTSLVNSGDTAWLLTSTALVLFMTIPGLALFYGGLARTKNVLSILMQCFAITCLVTVIWLAVGYGLAFGDGGGANAWIGGLGQVLLSGVERGSVVEGQTIPETVWVMFQLTFAIITPALVVGGVAERMRFGPMLWFSGLWLLLVYVPVAHWVWGGGWLQERGLLDFAGGTVVHINAGVAALVAALVLGPRKGFPSTPMPPHNLTMTVAGASMLWVGWFGFNAGSAVASNSDAGMAMLVTHIGAAGGSLAWMTTEWVRHGKPSVLGIVTGMVAGLGTITPASGFVGPAAALIIGVVAGCSCYWATFAMKQRFHIDDSLDVFPVHGVGGIIGTLLAGVFVGTLGGAGLAEGVSIEAQVGTQLLGIVAVATWCAVVSFVLLKVLDGAMGLRVGEEDETEGLDLILHEERGYNL